MKVSILVPTFSRPLFLGQTLDAILASPYQELEVIVGDDGNLGREVCLQRSDPRLRYVKNPVRLGMAMNWNALLDRASGDVVGLCMDDDRLHPEFVARCVAIFESNPEVDVVFTNHNFVTADSRFERQSALTAGIHANFSQDFVQHLPVAVSAALIRRDYWDLVSPLPDTAAADMVLFGRLAEAGATFYYIAEPLMDYRGHAEMLSATQGFRTDRIEAWEGLRFSDPVAEKRRLMLLAEARLSRAKLHLQLNMPSSARADARRALLGGSVIQRWRALGIAVLSRAPGVGPLIARAIRLLRAGRLRLR